MDFLFNCFVFLLIVGAIIGIGVFLLSRVDPNADPDEKKSQAILTKGQTYRAFVVLPSPEIYASDWPDTITSCQVVFIKQPKFPDEDRRLQTLAKRLLTFQAGDKPSKDEQIIANVFKSEIGYPTPLRLPDRISDGAEAYTVSVKMRKNTYPEGWKPQPFFDIKVVFDGPDAGARRANHVIPEKYRTAAM